MKHRTQIKILLLLLIIVFLLLVIILLKLFLFNKTSDFTLESGGTVIYNINETEPKTVEDDNPSSFPPIT